MLIRIWLLGMTFALVCCELTGDHICEVEEGYPVNITEYSLRNVTVRNYKWCMGFPPRCSFYTTKAVKVPETVERLQIRLVRKCCPGFAENSSRNGCVPCKKCFEGTCGNDGNCLCNPGFRGNDCADACEPMRWGANCQQPCLCEHGTCNPRSGRCDCPTGWFGTRCEVPCLEGFYGKHCISRCSCGERDLCSPETGECSKKPPRQQEHQSTRAIHYMTEDVLNLTISLNRQKSTPSLKKYHTFDMDLTANNITGREDKIIYKENRKPKNYGIVTNRPIDPKAEISNQTIPYRNTVKSSEDSAESTTEISSEIAHNVESVQLIDDNGSLENYKSNSNENSKEIIDENFESKEKTTTPSITSKADKSTIIKKTEETPNEIDVFENKVINQENTRRPKVNLGSYDTTQAINKYQSRNGTTTTPIFDTNTTIPREINETTNGNFSPTVIIPRKDVTVHEIEDIFLPIEFNSDPKTTPSTKENELFSPAKILEENELQNLDVRGNILTSKETTTQSSPIYTTVAYNTIPKKGVLPFADVVPSTKSFELKNDLDKPESTENQISMKGAYERRNKDEEFGEGASEEFEYSANKSDITTHMSVAALVSFILVLILAGIILLHQYTQRRKKNANLKIDGQNYPGGHTVSVYTHSIFHTPLPDPPTFENPVFKPPSEISSDHRTFQTHVICSLNFPENQVNDEKEYTYDHPPSTGSYRAASIPEPPEMHETLNSEPVYDEIPNRRGNQPLSPPPSYKSSCLYMNTCGKTRF